jgi:hypothetical protein
VARQALPMFLNVSAAVTNWSADGTECSLVSGEAVVDWLSWLGTAVQGV